LHRSISEGPFQNFGICSYGSLVHNILTPPPLLMEHQMLISQTSIDTRFKIVNAKHLNTDPYYYQLL
jgi:hypothetical protein